MVYCNKSGKGQNGPISVKWVCFASASQIEELWYIVIRAGGARTDLSYFREIGPFCLPDRGAVVYCIIRTGGARTDLF